MSVAKASQTNLFSTSTKPGSLTKRHILVVNAAQRWLEKWHLKIPNENTRCLQLKTWRESAKPEKEFACEECQYTTMTKAYLKDHIRRMHVARGVGWVCVEGACEKKPKTFVNNMLLLQHKKDHQNLPCQIWSKTFTSKRSLNRHRKQVHKPEQQNADEDSANFVQAHTVDFEELMNLCTFDLEGALVIPLDLDPLTSWWFEMTHPHCDMLWLIK